MSKIKELLKDKTVKVDKKWEIIIKILIIISWPIFNFYLNSEFGITPLIILSSMIIFIILINLFSKFEINRLQSKTLLLSFVLSCYMDNLFMNIISFRLSKMVSTITLSINIHCLYEILYFMFSFLFLPTIVFVVYIFLNKLVPVLKEKIKEIDNTEKKYICIVLIIGIILSTFVMSSTRIFEKAEGTVNDIVYTSDIGYLTYSDVWSSVGNFENDIRQPFFGVFSLPFSIVTHLISEIVFFIPKEYSYPFVMIIMQFFLMSISIVMLSKLMNIEQKNKKYFFMLLSLNFPFILFGLVLEQYVIGLFYLILTMYLYQQTKENEINNSYIAAVGTLSTSIVLIPFIAKFDSLTSWLKKAFQCFKNAILVLILSGRTTLLFSFFINLNQILRFTGTKVTWYSKLCQYLNFVKSIVISPKGSVVVGDLYSYQMNEVTKISIIGTIILVVILISFILNRKDKFAKISFLWVLYSILILFVIGWGTQENGLILYSLYFYWAFYALYYMLIKKVVKDNKISNILITISTFTLLFFTFPTLYEILKFGITYYPR